MKRLVVTIVALALPAHAAAQELSVFASGVRPGSFDEQSYGIGGSLAGYARLGAAFAPGSRFSRLNTRIGVRLIYFQHRSSEFRENRCSIFIDPCQYDPHTAHSRLSVAQAALQLGVLTLPSTRAELGAGVGQYVYGGEAEDASLGLNWNVTASRRIVARWWLTADYTMHGVLQGLYIADASRFDPPEQSLRLGLMYRVSKN